MPAERKPGMDHPHYDWSPISLRDEIRWPDNARVAVCPIIVLEHMEWQPPTDSFQVGNLAGGSVARPFPDYARISHREYGHRVGIFRILDVLERLGMKATVAMDALTAENYPFLVRHCLERGCEIIGHGISVSRMISGGMSPEAEAEYIRESLEAVTRAVGHRPSGWFGPEYGESERTPELLAHAGIKYVCDWPNDEQPYPLKTSQGDLVALPMMLELDDVIAMAQRRVPVDRYGQMIQECFDGLYRDGLANGRLLALNLHPWLVGQPFRIGYLEQALEHVMRCGGVWAAKGSEIVDWYLSQRK